MFNFSERLTRRVALPLVAAVDAPPPGCARLSARRRELEEILPDHLDHAVVLRQFGRSVSGDLRRSVDSLAFRWSRFGVSMEQLMSSLQR